MNLQNMTNLFVTLFLLLGLSSCSSTTDPKSDTINPVQNTEYLGQTPPGTTPLKFPPNSFLPDNIWFYHGSPSFSPDGKEMYWVKYIRAANRTEIWFTECINNQWTAPQKPTFALSTTSENNPVFSQSRDTLYFQSNRSGSSIYMVTRSGGNWSQPTRVIMPIPTGKSLGLQFAVAKNKTIYGELWNSAGTISHIYRWRFVNGQYTNAEGLSDSINTQNMNFMPFVDPEERYILFTSDRNATQQFFLYASIKAQDGTWGNPVKLNSAINGTTGAHWPFITRNGLYFFFITQKEGDSDPIPYWVNASVINNLMN